VFPGLRDSQRDAACERRQGGVGAVLRRNYDRGRYGEADSRIARLRREYELVHGVVAVRPAADEVSVARVCDCEGHVAGCFWCWRERAHSRGSRLRHAQGSVAGCHSDVAGRRDW